MEDKQCFAPCWPFTSGHGDLWLFAWLDVEIPIQKSGAGQLHRMLLPASLTPGPTKLASGSNIGLSINGLVHRNMFPYWRRTIVYAFVTGLLQFEPHIVNLNQQWSLSSQLSVLYIGTTTLTTNCLLFFLGLFPESSHAEQKLFETCFVINLVHGILIAGGESSWAKQHPLWGSSFGPHH